ncbi:hypothetical protein NCC78_07185 [Micromonospora phytophila]|nr:hypothetical protein [Micromonospora phytophila]MCM0674471.1 hypothetical protein [Micromonospora phytophila]
MAEDVHDDSWRHACPQEQRRAGVPQVMKADGPHTGPDDQPAEGGVQVAWFDVAAGGGGKHQARLLPMPIGEAALMLLAAAVTLERLDHDGRHRQHAAGAA